MNEISEVAVKTCTKCNAQQPLSSFSKNGNGLRSMCKTCRCSEAKVNRQANAEAMREKDRAYYLTHKNEMLAKSKTYCVSHRDDICANKKEYYQKNRDTILEYHANNKSTRNMKKSERRKNDTIYRLKESLKARVHKVLHDKQRDRSWSYIGCTHDELKVWIEFQFDATMSWDNYASHWHLDHVIPIDKFNLAIKESQYVCFHWSNLRPLDKKENMSKSNRIILSDVFNHRLKLKTFISDNLRYQTMPEKAWWLRNELRYGKNPEDDFATWLANEMGNPQPSS